MIDMIPISASKDGQNWKELGIQQEGALLFTSISIAEGEILNFMDGKEHVTLTDLVNQLDLPMPIIMMGMGVLIREGLVAAKRHNKYVLLTMEGK